MPVQPRTSPIKFGNLAEKSEQDTIPSLSTSPQIKDLPERDELGARQFGVFIAQVSVKSTATNQRCPEIMRTSILVLS